MSTSEISIRILPSGQIRVDLGEKITNQKIYDLLSPHISDQEKLANFLFQWEERNILIGPPDLCG